MKKHSLVCDALSLFLLTALQTYLLHKHLSFTFQDQQGGYRWVAIAMSMTPLYTLYFFLRLVLPCLIAALLTGGLSFLLTKVHNVKQALTTVPLTWTDTSRTDNLSVVPHYIAWNHVLFALLGIIGGHYCIELTQRGA